MNPLFSIAIPAFKKRFLQESILSVIKQTVSNWELVIVDDCSPEDLKNIVTFFNDTRIKYFKNPKNIGAIDVVDNWNKCLEYVTGEYIICMGDDDKLLPNCLEDYISLIKKYPGLGLYHTWTEIIDENGNYIELQEPRPEWESAYSLIWNRWKGRRQYIGDFLFNVKKLKDNGGFYKFPLAWASDDISAIIAAQHKGVANSQKVGFCYRINSQTISNTGNVETKMDAIEKEIKWYKGFLLFKPTDNMDEKYWLNITKEKDKYFEKKKGLTIAKDLRSHSIFRIIFWFLRRKKYGLNTRILVYAIIQSFK